MDSVRSWVVGVARSVICAYLYPKMVGLWAWTADVRIFDTRPWRGGGAGRGVDAGDAVFPGRAGGRLWPLAVVALSTVIASEYNG